MKIWDLFDLELFVEMQDRGYIRTQACPFNLSLSIANYTAAAAHDRVWNAATLNCRGLIWNVHTSEIIARPFPKFFNFGEPEAPAVDMDEPVVVTDKLDGSLGILYPTRDGAYGIATRGSFTSEQAIHATEVLHRKYHKYEPPTGVTCLFEIIYPANRIVINYGTLDDLIFIGAIDNETGEYSQKPIGWPGHIVPVFSHMTFKEALEAPPRENAEGYVVYLLNSNQRVKLKQDDYVELHRIVTGLSSKTVWEVEAVRACQRLISSPTHWATYLGIAPRRALEILAAGDEWIEKVPDEFYPWIEEVQTELHFRVREYVATVNHFVEEARVIPDRRERFQVVSLSPFQKEIMRAADGKEDAFDQILMRAWRLAYPAEVTYPTTPRTEDND